MSNRLSLCLQPNLSMNLSSQSRFGSFNNKIFRIVALCCFYAVFYNFYKASFHNSLDWLTLPWERLCFTINNDNEFGHIDSTILKKESDIYYIFVFDVSGSVQGKIDKPNWYDGTLSELENSDYLPKYKNRFNTDASSININLVAKIYLYNTLLQLLPDGDNHTDDKFSVWTLGDVGKRLLPRVNESGNQSLVGKNIAEINSTHIALAINRTLVLNYENSTDFNDLFVKILKNYSNNIEEDKKSGSNYPSIIITFISDMLHDIDEKPHLNEKIEENWTKLQTNIEQLANANLMANMVVFTKSGKIEQQFFADFDSISIYDEFKENLDWHRIEKQSYFEKFNSHLLFPTIKAETPFIYYYNGNKKVMVLRQILWIKKRRLEYEVSCVENLEDRKKCV